MIETIPQGAKENEYDNINDNNDIMQPLHQTLYHTNTLFS